MFRGISGRSECVNKNMSEYGVQPAYNETFLPTCPPSYSEAVASAPSVRVSPNPMENSGFQSKMDIPQGLQVQTGYIQPQVITLPLSVGPRSCRLQCPNCHAQIKTKTTSGCQKSAHITCFLLCLFGCFLCSCIPYCLNSYKNVHHHCPVCKTFIGTYRG